ncbi:ATP synthase F1 subunit epsilon [Cuneatibacter caecimuris]|uniref:ATP synthase epsilon chain n=1 Tax=Cuneatibacter caecimuris TaxID=1796618 RepID=A0A4V2F5Y4_9FIRM|nr:ATP synthase F1 subunit epsilon [Cuneatibacter caecimuris]RZS94429.1 F-type H+-transporting ATPase subunit epsilon [Cuneatibacter caecimuris]
MAEDSKKYFRLQIMTPERIFFDGQADFVEMTTSEGEIGIYRNHVPTTCILMPGPLRIYDGDQEKTAAVHAGFVEILQDSVRVLAEIAEWPEEIDLNRAEEARIRAERRLKGDDPDANLARAEIALRRALTRLEVAGK